MRRLLSRRQALFAQAAFFAVAHHSTLHLPSFFALGLLLGALRQLTSSLYPSMVVSVLWNLWSTLSDLHGW